MLVTTKHRVFVVPQDADDRHWKHRMPKREPGDFGELCLWYPKDPAALTWRWRDGSFDLLSIAHRHLQYEEFWRRYHVWPVEDAPHGHGKNALLTTQMQEAAQRWER